MRQETHADTLLPLFGSGIKAVVKTILREGGYVNQGLTKVVARPGSLQELPSTANLTKLLRSMAETEELVQYQAKRNGQRGLVYGMRGIIPEVCKAQDEFQERIELLEYQIEKLKNPKWIALARHAPQMGRLIRAWVPEIADLDFIGQVNGAYVGESRVRVSFPAPHPSTGRFASTFVAEYRFTHWLPINSNPFGEKK